MQYSTDCGCAPAPKPVKTVSVQPLAPTEEIVCPDARCLPHLLNSLPETDDAVPNYVGVYKGRSYIAPISALVDSQLKASLNKMYRSGEVAVVASGRDIEAMPVIQKGNCEKIGQASMPTIAEAMMASLPAAPANYEPAKVLTTDADGAVYLATSGDVVAAGFVEGASRAYPKVANVPVLDRILGYGAKAGEFGYATLKQLQEALAAIVGVATPKTLPDTLLGYKSGVQYKYPVSMNKALTIEGQGNFAGSKTIAAGNGAVKTDFARVKGPTLSEGLWIVSITGFCAVGSTIAQNGYVNWGMTTPLGGADVLVPTFTSAASTADKPLTLTISRTLYVPAGGSYDLFADPNVIPGLATAAEMKGTIVFTAQQISLTNVVVNGVA